MVEFNLIDSALGDVLIAVKGKAVCDVRFNAEAHRLIESLEEHYSSVKYNPNNAVLQLYSQQLDDYLTQPKRSLDWRLDIQGTDFQKKVWQAIQSVPLGKVASYSDIAYQIGKPSAVRAVANACGANRHAIVIPCHRIVAKDGSIGGYSIGLENKRFLLSKEGINI